MHHNDQTSGEMMRRENVLPVTFMMQPINLQISSEPLEDGLKSSRDERLVNSLNAVNLRNQSGSKERRS